MSVSRSNFVKFLTGRHRPPFIGQVQEALALFGGRSTLREGIANARKMFVFSLIAGHGLMPPIFKLERSRCYTFRWNQSITGLDAVIKVDATGDPQTSGKCVTLRWPLNFALYDGVDAVPEPSTLGLISLGLLGLGGMTRRRRHRASVQS